MIDPRVVERSAAAGLGVGVRGRRLASQRARAQPRSARTATAAGKV
ncbi:MAG: hypothetical protein OXK79_13110 [Chloroflexota bacterium]|nr:hypothetical protein [Chloroflexota bacterium]